MSCWSDLDRMGTSGICLELRGGMGGAFKRRHSSFTWTNQKQVQKKKKYAEGVVMIYATFYTIHNLNIVCQRTSVSTRCFFLLSSDVHKEGKADGTAQTAASP